MAALRAVLASDFMTADEAELPYALLKKKKAGCASPAKRAAIWRMTRGVASTSSLRRLSGSQFAFSLATIAVFQPLLAT